MHQDVWMICNDMVFRGERKTENGGDISLRQQSVKGGTILKWLQLTASEGEDQVNFNVTQPKMLRPNSTPPRAGNNDHSLNAI